MKLFRVKFHFSYALYYPILIWETILLCNLSQFGYALKYKISDQGCAVIDDSCLDLKDVPSYEAIKQLHRQLDDDSSGDIDLLESVDFIKEELQHTKDIERRQERFHHNNDNHISVNELWRMWKQSEVHNWTIEMTVGWLQDTVGLHQYTEAFYQNSINGSYLPRIAANLEHFLSKELGVKSIDKPKLTVKAMDIVLFGPPKDSGHLVKDIFIVLLLTVVFVGGTKFYINNNNYKSVVNQMLLDMEKLREAEQAFREEFKNNLERSDSGSSLTYEDDKSEDKMTKTGDTESIPPDIDLDSDVGESFKSTNTLLQNWLQLTYERERVAFNKKQQNVRDQFRRAKDMCDKLNKKRQTLLGVLVSAHGNTMDNVDKSISEARTTMEEVAAELREREDRWQQIERLSGFTITRNIGLTALELLLRPQINGSSRSTFPSSIVHQLLSNQSALMFLTMGGYSGINSSRDSPSFLPSSITRDWRQSCESSLEGSIYPSTQTLHQSQTVSSGLGSLVSKASSDSKQVYRSTSDHLFNSRLDCNDSSADEGSVTSNILDRSVASYNSDNFERSSSMPQTQSTASISASEPVLEQANAKTPSAALDDATSICSSVLDEKPSKSFSRKGAKTSFINSLRGIKSKKKHKDKAEAK